MPIKNILFDLDGTIGNTLPLCIAAFRAAIEPFAERSLSDEEIIATFGPSEEGTIAALLPDHQAEGLRRYLASYEALHPEWPAPFKGMLEVLDFLKANRAFVGLVTGKGEVSANMTLRRYGLSNFFDVVKTGAATGPVKDVRITEVLREYSLQKDETLYVGDVPSDITASRDCGIRIAAAAWAPTSDEEKLRALSPDFLFTSVPQFLEFLKDEFGM
ncbi:HAD family hydrolase [Bythopirellula polymerisocia]|uniref:phosphoglycolate phosphatase n=1 Tax=Bythopirellula polymerisocia TaxID=2528003 RepID=A0A5C6CMA4_9BACT|nr:HAD hydrolase-like protein [Bythopirellula polymerisocia]TWU25538.1 Pyrophosphatase PpaX [Bythopirellula polymerisocia]